MYLCMSVGLYVCMYVSMYVCIYLCMYACMYVPIYVCMHACISWWFIIVDYPVLSPTKKHVQNHIQKKGFHVCYG